MMRIVGTYKKKSGSYTVSGPICYLILG